MKSLVVALACFVFLACGNSTSPGPGKGTVYFRMNTVSCKYNGTKDITFYIGADVAGTETINSGVSSAAYLTKPSAEYDFPERMPVVQARIGNYTPDGGALWTKRTNIKVMRDQSMTHTFEC